MNEAHLHLAVNHFPITGLVFGLLVLLAGFIFKSPQVKATALGIFIVSAIVAIVAFQSGEGAEEIVEELPGMSHEVIHEHEEIAEVFFTLILTLGGLSLITWFTQIRKLALTRYAYVLVFLLAVASMVVSFKVGDTGGEIRHTEIREGSAAPQPHED